MVVFNLAEYPTGPLNSTSQGFELRTPQFRRKCSPDVYNEARHVVLNQDGAIQYMCMHHKKKITTMSVRTDKYASKIYIMLIHFCPLVLLIKFKKVI